jgi:hypothetical protein
VIHSAALNKGQVGETMKIAIGIRRTALVLGGLGFYCLSPGNATAAGLLPYFEVDVGRTQRGAEVNKSKGAESPRPQDRFTVKRSKSNTSDRVGSGGSISDQGQGGSKKKN